MEKNSITILNIFIIIVLFCTTIIIYFNYDNKNIINNNLLKYNKNIQNNLGDIKENFDNYNDYNDILINQRKDNLFNEIKDYKELDLPINVNDNGNKCNNWNKDILNRYPNGGNNCKK